MQLPLDKKAHLVGGATMALVFFIISAFCPAPIAVILDVTVVAFGWELLQWYRKNGTPEVWDAVATSVGGIVVVLIAVAIKNLYM